MNEWNLNSLKRGYYSGYSSSNEPGTIQSIFATVLPILPSIIFDKYNQNNLGNAENNGLSKKSEFKFMSNMIDINVITVQKLLYCLLIYK